MQIMPPAVTSEAATPFVHGVQQNLSKCAQLQAEGGLVGERFPKY